MRRASIGVLTLLGFLVSLPLRAETLHFDDLTPESSVPLYSYHGFNLNARLVARLYSTIQVSRNPHPDITQISSSNIGFVNTVQRGTCVVMSKTGGFTLNSMYIMPWQSPSVSYAYGGIPTRVQFHGYRANTTGASYFLSYKFLSSGPESFQMQFLEFDWPDLVELRICPSGGVGSNGQEITGSALIDNIVVDAAMPTPTPTPPPPPEEQCDYRHFGNAVVCY